MLRITFCTILLLIVILAFNGLAAYTAIAGDTAYPDKVTRLTEEQISAISKVLPKNSTIIGGFVLSEEARRNLTIAADAGAGGCSTVFFTLDGQCTMVHVCQLGPDHFEMGENLPC